MVFESSLVDSTAPQPKRFDPRQSFLRYLERRTGNRDTAEDLLHDAFTTVVIEPGLAPDDEAVVPWFYRHLRKAVIGRLSGRASADRAFEVFARELDAHEHPQADVEAEIGACVARLARTLRSEYAEALLAIEVEKSSVKNFADRKGISESSATERVFRAREALKTSVTQSCGACAANGCLLCTCEGAE